MGGGTWIGLALHGKASFCVLRDFATFDRTRPACEEREDANVGESGCRGEWMGDTCEYPEKVDVL